MDLYHCIDSDADSSSGQEEPLYEEIDLQIDAEAGPSGQYQNAPRGDEYQNVPSSDEYQNVPSSDEYQGIDVRDVAVYNRVASTGTESDYDDVGQPDEPRVGPSSEYQNTHYQSIAVQDVSVYNRVGSGATDPDYDDVHGSRVDPDH